MSNKISLIPFCDCKVKSASKKYVFNENCASFIFCESCITSKSIPQRRLCFFKSVISQRLRYDCCKEFVKPEEKRYSVYTKSDMTADIGGGGIVCRLCNTFQIGEFHFSSNNTSDCKAPANVIDLITGKTKRKNSTIHCNHANLTDPVHNTKKKKLRKPKLCLQSNCIKRASFGFATPNSYDYCSEHKSTGI